MARYILPVAGAIAGSFIGQPALGWAIGSAIGGLVDPQKIQGPRIGDISQQTSQEGIPRPIVYGLSQPIAGNIIATSEPNIVRRSQRQGKGGPKVETESVYRTYAIRVCEGEASFVRVWRNGILVYDISPALSLGSIANTQFLQTARFFNGTFDQLPSPDLEALFGVGTTPAHRGTAYMVMANEDLTDLRGSIPQWTFQVQQCFIRLLGQSILVAGADTPEPIPTSVLGYSQFAFGSMTPDYIVPGVGITALQYNPVDDNLTLQSSADLPLDLVGISFDGEIYLLEDAFSVSEMQVIWVMPDSPIVYGDTYTVYFLQSAGDACTCPLPDLILDLAERAGIDSSFIDVSELDADVRGFTVTNVYPVSAALQSLSEVFLFDPSNYDGQVHFIPRGGNSVATITEDDMVDDEDDIEQTKRMDAISIPRVLNLSYYDVAGGLNTDKQTSERSGDRRATGEASLQTAVILSADEAAQIVAINHKVGIEDQKGELQFSLPDSWLFLAPSNPIIVQWNGRSERCRIAKLDINDGFQEYTCLRDRQSAYTSEVEGIPAAPQTPPPSSVVGETLIEILDIHILRDADDAQGLGYYVAVSGLLEAWQGATIELSLDAGANYIDSATWNVSAIMGETTTTMADHPQAYPDEVSTVSVLIDTPYAEILSTDLVGLLNRQNLALIGDEIIQFANADETSEGTWELSYFLRGRKGTAAASHASGSRFVLLDRSSIPFIPAELVYLNRTLTFRATSFGTTPDTGTVVSVLFVGQSQTEREAAYLMAHIDSSDAVITWQGVGRLGAGAQVAQSAYFIGYRVTITDGVLTSTYDTLNQFLTQDVSGFGSPLTIIVQQRNQLTGLGPAIQIIL